MCEFNFFNQILLSLFGVSNTFHDSIEVVYVVLHIFIHFCFNISWKTCL